MVLYIVIYITYNYYLIKICLNLSKFDDIFIQKNLGLGHLIGTYNFKNIFFLQIKHSFLFFEKSEQ